MTVPTKEDAKKAMDKIGTTFQGPGGYTSVLGISIPISGETKEIRAVKFDGNGVNGEVHSATYPSQCTESFDQVWPTIQAALENGNQLRDLHFTYGGRNLEIDIYRDVVLHDGSMYMRPRTPR